MFEGNTNVCYLEIQFEILSRVHSSVFSVPYFMKDNQHDFLYLLLAGLQEDMNKSN